MTRSGSTPATPPGQFNCVRAFAYSVGSSGVAVFDDFLAVCFVVDLFLCVPVLPASARVRESSEFVASISYLKCLRKLRPSVPRDAVLEAGRTSHKTFFTAKLPTRHRFEMHALGVKL